jgi:hypothetical protein
MLQGLLPTGEYTTEELESRLLDGRYCEIRMLFYVGKDLLRWVEQCMEFVERHPALRARQLTTQSFISYLITKTPVAVQAKLRKWGVADYRSIFSRAIALNLLFAKAPDRGTLSNDFVRNYYRFTDSLFKMNMQGPVPEIESSDFEFELYASGEYSRMLEREWGGEAAE